MARSHQRSHKVRNLLVGFLAILVLYALAGFLLLPWWLERTLPEQLNQRLGWQGEVAGIQSNPFTLTLAVEGLTATDPGGEQVLALDRVLLDLNGFQLIRGIVGFERIELDEPYLRLDLLADDRLNLARDWQQANPQASDAADPEATADGAAPPLYFGEIDIHGGELLFRDFTREAMTEFRVTPLTLSLSDLATWQREGQQSDYALEAAVGSQTLEWRGDLSVSPFYSTGSLAVSSLNHETLAHFLGPSLPYDLRGGSVDVRSDYAIQAGEVFRLETSNGQLSLDNLAVALTPDSEQARLSNGTLAVEAIAFDFNARELSIGQVTVADLDLAVARNQAGQIDWLMPLAASGQAQEAQPAENPAQTGQPLRWSLAGISVTGGRLLWQDSQPATAAELTLADVAIDTGRLSHRLEEPVTYEVSASLASGGRLSLNGQLTPAPFTLEAAIAGSDVTLAAFEPYLQEAANLAIAGGSLGVDGNLDLDGQQEPLTGTFSGTAEVAGLNLRLPDSAEPLLRWQTLRLAPIEYNVHPARLEIGTVTLADPFFNLVRGADSVHNVARIARDAGTEPDNGAPDGSENGPSSEPEFIFRIGQLVLENGELAYTDRTLEPAFTTSFDALSGTVTGLSNISPQEGKVSIRGRVGGVADLDFQGTIGTLGTEDVSDLKLLMEDLSLPALSPYFGRYLGYGVDSGKLDLNLDYEIAGTRIDASNLVVLDRLELGSAVASDQAVNAPVKLGLALLRDRRGVIEVDLPISGDLADPEFSVGKVVMRAFVNLLAKTAASPFSMLGSIAELAGLSGEELGKVDFLPGSVQLAEGEAEKLAALADALLDRPNLLLNIRGNVAPEADGLALLREELTAGGQSLSEAQWQAAREAYLAGERSLAPEALSNLASSRGVAIRKVLRDTHGVPSNQLFLLDPARNAGVGDGGNVVVAFSLDVR